MRVALFCILSATIVLVSSVGLREEFIYRLRIVNYIFSIHSENNIPMGANVWRNKLFITVPRRRLGIPSTLNYVRLDSPQKHNVPLTPYPSWAKNVYSGYETPTENLFSVYRVAVDPCDRLWFVDTGLLELPGNRTKIKPMTLVIMDLNTDTVIRRYTIPKYQLKDTSVIATVTVDITEFCDKAFAYLPDFAGFGLIVYDFRRNRSWRVSHNYFHPEPGASNLTIGGLSFQFNDGVFSVELSQVKSNGFRDMYFHALAGTHMYKVSTELLRNETLATVTNIYKNDIKVS
ncbi:hypothetical protein NQ318_014950 [Aromia moschata]|uniref:Uncharacterized protein n=1 Tax=Aromia moschata TaxID=1265417 RepID=A0AAV8XM57_9CUCU|nr:hypothetical protein NQ318_014950 [Aromia moschata]